MLTDDKSKRFFKNFTGQWLQTNNTLSVNIAHRTLARIYKNEKLRDFYGQHRRWMQDETTHLVAYVTRENRPATELLTADYSFLNKRLAEWYDLKHIKKPKGNKFEKVDLKKHPERGGILKHGSIHVLTANPTQTSPVKRGLFVLENILAVPPPGAVPDVPSLEEALGEAKKQNKNITVREALALHSKDKSCASCHARMDPIGFAMEVYSPAGHFIKADPKRPIDTSGELGSGEKFQDIHELSLILADKKEHEFLTAITEKLITFGVGRGIEYFDAPTVEQIVADAVKKSGGKNATLKDLIHGVVQSAPFQKRRGDGGIFSSASSNH